jgi:primary-amine oxidase
MYYRPQVDDSQYSFPLDFCPIFDADKQEIIHIDIPEIRRPLSKAKPNNYHSASIEAEGGYRKDIKPINITQPDGVSFKVDGRVIDWQKWKVHVGFNYKEGIVLNNITYNDNGTVRPVFYRLSLAEMVVPYGNPEHPHQRKHAFDLGEYGGGYMTNSLSLGCDCKGAIHYMDAAFVNKAGQSTTIKNAICIHEEDAGILFKHSDFRDDSVIVTRGRKLIVSHIFTAANYEYCVYWIFHQDGTIQLEIKLTGILNTYAMNPGEDTKGWGTEVYPGVNAHNHQHLFCLRIDPNIDGPNNTVFQVDATQGPGDVGSSENPYGNAFFAKKTKYTTVKESLSDYDGVTSRTWDMANTNKLNPYSHKPVSYKLVSREVPKLLPKEGSLVWKRAGFARHAVHVTKCIYTLLPMPNLSLLADFLARLRRPAVPSGPARPTNVRRAFSWHPRMDRRRRCWNREYRHCSLAHVRHHAFPISRRLPSHARRTDDTFAAAAELFHEESCAGCSAELL